VHRRAVSQRDKVELAENVHLVRRNAQLLPRLPQGAVHDGLLPLELAARKADLARLAAHRAAADLI